MKKFLIGACALVFALSASYVVADYEVTHGTGTVISAFTCFTTKVCPAHVNINSAGTEVGTVANPLSVNPTGTTTQPVSQVGAPWGVTFSGTQTVAGTVTANAGTNTSTALLAKETGGNLATIAGLTLGQASATAAQKGILGQCAVTSSAPTYTTAQTDPFSCDTAGNLRVNVTSATGLAQASATSGQSGSLVMGAATTSPPTYTTAQTNPISLDPAGNTRVAPSASASGGATPYHSYSVATNPPPGVSVKASAGTVYTLSLQNTTATVYYFKFYDKASAPTCNSDAVVWATAVSALATGYNTTISLPTGLVFNNGIGFCITGVQADNDNTQAATGINISIAYK